MKVISTKIFSLFVLLTCLSLAYSSHESYQRAILNLLDKYESAKCIDGSSPGYYFRNGYGDGSSKFLIHFEGGAWCQGTTETQILQSCLSRSLTTLGSSKQYVSAYTNDAFLNNTIAFNPAFYNWNIVHFKYCDGMTYQGNTQREFNGTTLYFHGKLNTIALFADLLATKNLNNADSVVFSGSSAGGIGATNWSEYLRNILPSNIVQFHSIIDSGFFTDDGWFNPTMWRLIVDIAYDNRREELVPANCPYLYNDDELFKCVQPAYTYAQLQVPTLLLMSAYDPYVLRSQKHMTCIGDKNGFQGFENCSEDQMAIAEELRSKTIIALKQVQVEKNNISVWSVSCVQHQFMLGTQFYTSGLFDAPDNNLDNNEDQHYDITASHAIVLFLSQPNIQHSFIDYSKYPGNVKCSYLVSDSVALKTLDH